MSKMMPNMGRFGSTPAPPNPPVANPATSNAPSSMSSIASMAAMGKSMTKKFEAGLHMSNLDNLLNIPNPLVDNEKKSKLAAAEKKSQISQVLSILDDVHLQCPPSHIGIILAYTGSKCAPIINPGIKFTWFRMSGEDQVDTVDESIRAWYAPTVDDIGCVICAQCEDNFDQGCSRYNEVNLFAKYLFLCAVTNNKTSFSRVHIVWSNQS